MYPEFANDFSLDLFLWTQTQRNILTQIQYAIFLKRAQSKKCTNRLNNARKFMIWAILYFLIKKLNFENY